VKRILQTRLEYCAKPNLDHAAWMAIFSGWAVCADILQDSFGWGREAMGWLGLNIAPNRTWTMFAWMAIF